MNETWQVLLVCIGLIGAWGTIIIAVQKLLINRCVAPLKEGIAELKEVPKEHVKLEKQLLALKADLPLSYVRREDFIRFDTVINVKLDRLRDLIEAIKEQK